MKDSNLNKKDINFNELITKVNTLTKDIHCAGIMIYIKSISGFESSYIQINSPKKDVFLKILILKACTFFQT